MTKNVNYLSQKKSKEVVNGSPKLPLATDLSDGELAINYAKGFETIAIKNDSGDVVTFSSDNYISTNYYNKSEVDDLISASSGGSGGTYITVNADWDEQDEDAPSFILNKPFGESDSTINIYNNSSKGLTQCGQHCFGAFQGSLFDGLFLSETLVDGQVYTVNVNGNEFEITASTYSGTIGLNWSGDPSTVETVAVWGNGTEVSISINDSLLNGNTDNASISISKTGSVLVQLDNKFVNYSGSTYIQSLVGRIEDLEDGGGTVVAGGFKVEDNPTVTGQKGLVNKLSQYYDTNIGNHAVIEGDGYTDSESTYNIVASGNFSHAEGGATQANGVASHAEGFSTNASNTYSHAEGNRTTASGVSSHAEGLSTIAKGYASHAEGSSTTASGDSSHAEGQSTTASGYYSHAEGYSTVASGYSSHAEGASSIANGSNSHAEGQGTSATSQSSHAEGSSTKASGNYSHAEGYWTIANGNYSHAEGKDTKSNNQSEHASGQFNISSTASTTFGDSGNTLFSVGNGTSDNARSNAFEIRQNADIYIIKNGSTVKLQDQLGGGGSSTNVVILSQSEYDALATKDNNTVYIIK